jgi:hypothetical protein
MMIVCVKLLSILVFLSIIIEIECLSKQYPMMFGGFTDGADFNIERFIFSSDNNMIVAGNSNDP